MTPLQSSAKNLQNEDHMIQSPAEKIVENFYHYFNSSQLEKLYALISDDITHEINYGGIEKGKEKFIEHIVLTKKHFEEHLYDFVIMASKDDRSVTTRFKVKGKYIHTDPSFMPAKGQTYELTVMNYFEIEHGKITAGRCWFDENEFQRQVKNQYKVA